jgi:LysM repeat protein
MPSSSAEGPWFTITAVRPRELGASLALGCLAAVMAGCGDDDDAAARATLPPIQSTTTVAPTIPATTTQPRFYEVQQGDTLIEIADAFGLPMTLIMEKNGITNPDQIFAGQILELPLASEVVVATLPAPTTSLAGVAPTTTSAP